MHGFHILYGNLRFFEPLIIATVLGGLIGLERQVHGRPAGLRTHILVCLGSAAIIVAFERLHFFYQSENADFIRMDPARAAAGIITGIGFLGAGTILKGKDFVKGLTTAASIWVVAAIGITTGLGQYYLSMATTALVLFTLLVLDKIDIRSGHYGEIHLEGRGGIAFFETVQKKLTQLGFAIKGHSINVASPSGIVKLHLTVRYKGHAAGSDLISALSQIGGVKEISWEK